MVIAPEAAELGFWTVTVSEPVDATSAAEIATVSCDELTKVVVRGEPFHNATAPGRKPLPDRVNVVLPLLTVTFRGRHRPARFLTLRYEFRKRITALARN